MNLVDPTGEDWLRVMGKYFHDSSKGFTHGCVEIESEFFDDLREFIANNKKEGTMVPNLEIQVKYEKPNDPNSRTYGETDKKH